MTLPNGKVIQRRWEMNLYGALEEWYWEGKTENRSTGWKNFQSDTLSTTNPTWAGLAINPVLRDCEQPTAWAMAGLIYVKGKGSPNTAVCRSWRCRGSGGMIPFFLNVALDRSGWSATQSDRFTPGIVDEGDGWKPKSMTTVGRREWRLQYPGIVQRAVDCPALP